MEAALSSIHPRWPIASPRSCSNAAKAGRERKGLKSSIYSAIRCVISDPELGPTPRPSFTRLAPRSLASRNVSYNRVLGSAMSSHLSRAGDCKATLPEGLPTARRIAISSKRNQAYCIRTIRTYTNWNDGDPNRRPAFLESRGLHCCRDLTPPDMTRCVLSIPMDEQRTDPRFQCLGWAGHLPQILPFALNGATHSVCLQKPLQDSFEASIGTAVRDQSIGQLAHAVSLNGRYGCRSDRSITRFRAGRSEVGVGCPSDKSGTPGFR